MSFKPEEADRSLADAINAATRSVHTTLNKLVIYRLPLAMPPRADDPANYVSGLLYITPIYSTFESLWQKILDTPLPAEKNMQASGDHSCHVCQPSSFIHHTPNVLDGPHRPTVCMRIHSLLTHLHNPGLVRTDALEADIQQMTGWAPSLLSDELDTAASNPVLSTFLSRIRQSVHARPHVLLAYAWVLYMALFSGGRFIRASLARVDLSFWSPDASTLYSANGCKHDSSDDDDEEPLPPLRFFTFDAPHDGDDLKQAFKKRLAESSSLLTGQEKADIVDEAKAIFEFMVEVVGALDDVCGTQAHEKAEDDNDNEGLMGKFGRLLGLRTRDSVVVTKERRAWGKLAKGQRRESGEGTEGSGSENRSESKSPSSGSVSSGEDAVENKAFRGSGLPGLGPAGQYGKANGEHVRFTRTR